MKKRKYYKKLNIKKRKYFVKKILIEKLKENPFIKCYLNNSNIKIKSIKLNYNKKNFLIIKFTDNSIFTCKVKNKKEK